jgi:penicillin-binding protein 1A
MKNSNNTQEKTPLVLSPLLLLKWLIVTALWCGTIFAVYLLYIFHDLPDINKLEEVRTAHKVIILDHKDAVLATYGDVYGKYIDYPQIPRNLRNAVIATEDKRFFEHFGVDLWGIIRAAFANLKAGHTVQGGSTITQQLAKNTFLSSARTLKRKLQEAFLAIQLEQKYSKQQILTIYLNKAYLGSGIYGIDAAAKYYFGKNVRDLTLYESAIIAGLLKAPTKFAPTNNLQLSGERAYQILLNMLEDGYINKEDLAEASKHSVQLETSMMGSMRHHYFTDWIYEQVEQYEGDKNYDVIVKTTLSVPVQKAAESTFKKYMDEIHETRKVDQGAVIVMTPTGDILAMVGGRDFNTSPFNRATQAFRPTGSAFKLFVYATAMQGDYLPEDLIKDAPISYGTWSPRNFNRNYLGLITIQDAFAKSINTISVKLTDQVGLNNVIDLAHALGIQTHLEKNLSLSLGTASLTLLEMTSAYASIANHGIASNPHAILYIRNAHTGEFLYVRPFSEPKRVMSEEAFVKLDGLLTYAVENGTARGAKNKVVKISGKTGTSQDFRDAWFFGYTNKYVVGIWLGNDNYSPTKFVSGGTYPTLIGRDILMQLPLGQTPDARQPQTN